MDEEKNIWDIIYDNAKKNGCVTMEDMIEYLKKGYRVPDLTLYDYNDMSEGDEDNF